jgi:hypothetical protein
MSKKYDTRTAEHSDAFRHPRVWITGPLMACPVQVGQFEGVERSAFTPNNNHSKGPALCTKAKCDDNRHDHENGAEISVRSCFKYCSVQYRMFSSSYLCTLGCTF